MWLRIELNVLLRAFCVYTDLTQQHYMPRRYYGSTDLQKLPCCLPDQHNLERRIPETVSGQNTVPDTE
jgi:hypothetical protein